MDATGFNDSRSATSALATASSANHCAAVDAAFMVAACISRRLDQDHFQWQGALFLGGNSSFRGNDAFDYGTNTSAANTANAVRAIALTGFSSSPNTGQGW